MARAKATELAFACSCGALAGHLTADAVRTGTRVGCHCPDCRAAELYFDQPDPAPGPVDIFQTSPDGFVIDRGAEHLALMRLSPKGLFRWYAKCCNSPLATTLNSAKKPFVGVNVRRLADPDALGRTRAHGFVPQPDGSRKHRNIAPAVYGLLTRMLAGRLSGHWRKTPFFDASTGEPVAKPYVLDKQTRAALYR
ncbi:hypothetical protein KBY29_14435 [Ruegeria pomeroyi]|nr:hypothetical protein [Ruegeria pomeroyi]